MKSRETPAAGVFALSPVPQPARYLMFVLVVLLPAGITLAALTTFLQAASKLTYEVSVFGIDARLVSLLPVLLALMASLLLWWHWSRGVARRGVALVGDSIEVRTPLARQRVALAELDLGQARVANLDERTELQPLLKLWGATLPGFRSGWFLLRNRRRALVSTIGGRQLLWLPTRRKFDLLLEMQQPQAALDALRARA